MELCLVVMVVVVSFDGVRGEKREWTSIIGPLTMRVWGVEPRKATTTTTITTTTISISRGCWRRRRMPTPG